MTKRLVKTVSDDIVKVVVDYNLNPEKKKKKEIDTGLFSLIHKSKVREIAKIICLIVCCRNLLISHWPRLD